MPKVSILVPAYQAEKYVQRYIDSVLNFDYKHLELIIVNDGSSDQTHEIIKSNKEKIEAAGIEFKYICLEKNQGQANAINVGLKHVSGEYLSWHDIDDLYMPNCISKSLEILQKNPECKIVFSKALSVTDVNLNKKVNASNNSYVTFFDKKYKVIGPMPEKKFKHKDLLASYIFRKNVIWGPMRFVETKALFNVLKGKSIEVSDVGQNAQLLLPMVYKYKWIYIDEILCYCVFYNNSHSHKRDPYSIRHKFENLMLNIINNIDMPLKDKRKYSWLIKISFFHDDLKKYKPINLRLDLKGKKFKFFIFNQKIVYYTWGNED